MSTQHAINCSSVAVFMEARRGEAKFRDGVHSVDTDGLMHRMVKEELLTFEGKPLFPERRAYTVPYALSGAEQELYELVTQYVREEINRADRLKAAGEGRRSNTVGFALTILQRRLASSPEAIWRSLERRRKRLERTRQERKTTGGRAPSSVFGRAGGGSGHLAAAPRPDSDEGPVMAPERRGREPRLEQGE